MPRINKRYKVECLQSTSFMSWTDEEPQTAAELRSYFWNFDDIRTEKYSQFTMDFIQDMWEVRFIPV